MYRDYFLLVSLMYVWRVSKIRGKKSIQCTVSKWGGAFLEPKLEKTAVFGYHYCFLSFLFSVYIYGRNFFKAYAEVKLEKNGFTTA